MRNWIQNFIYREDLNWAQRIAAWPLDKIDTMFCMYDYRVKTRFREIKWAYQRVRYGHDDLAVWNMNSWFIKNAIPILDKWIENNCSYPSDMHSSEEWTAVLTQMRNGFQHYYDVEMGEGKDREPYTMIRTINGETTCEDIPGCETATRWTFTPEEEAEFQESLNLFTKYFYTLWD